MTEKEDFFWERRPQELCKMCGRCCRVSTTVKSYKELQELAEAGDKGAMDFLELFEPYESVEDAMLVDKAIVENIGYDENTTFYHCRFIQKNNLCSRYDTRKDLCRHCPSTPFAVVPPGCGFEDWLKEEKQKVYNKIKALKLEKESYIKELQKEGCTESRAIMLNKLITAIDNYINNYAKYGAWDL